MHRNNLPTAYNSGIELFHEITATEQPRCTLMPLCLNLLTIAMLFPLRGVFSLGHPRLTPCLD